MGELGEFTDEKTVRFERVLPRPIERVWEYVTKPELIATWLADADFEPGVGGRVELRMRHADDTKAGPPSAIIRGAITRWDPPNALAYTFRNAGPDDWAETNVSLELTSEGDRTRLLFVHTDIVGREWLAPTAAGWHTMLDDLQTRLAGGEPESFMPRLQAIGSEYQRRAAEV
jgi:uncharacterized protein YndB with AHSA1/START domain